MAAALEPRLTALLGIRSSGWLNCLLPFGFNALRFEPHDSRSPGCPGGPQPQSLLVGR